MRIAMIGTGYVGLVSGACFSDFGHVVTCIDRDAAKIRELQNGKIPIFEPGLDALVASNVEAGRLSFATESAAAIRAADAVFLAVGTPSRRGDGFADLSYVHDAARELADDGINLIVGSDRNRRLDHDDGKTVHFGRDFARSVIDVGEVGKTVATPRRSPDGEEYRIRGTNGRCRFCGK